MSGGRSGGSGGEKGAGERGTHARVAAKRPKSNLPAKLDGPPDQWVRPSRPIGTAGVDVNVIFRTSVLAVGVGLGGGTRTGGDVLARTAAGLDAPVVLRDDRDLSYVAFRTGPRRYRVIVSTHPKRR